MDIEDAPDGAANEIYNKTYENCASVPDILEEAISDLFKLSQINGMSEAEIDEALLRIVAERLEGEDDGW